MTLKDLADIIGGTISGSPDTEITGASGIEDAQDGDITYFLESREAALLERLTPHTVVIARNEIKDCHACMLLSENPQFTFARALEVLYSKPSPPPGISEHAVIGSNVTLGDDLSIGAQVVIGDNAVLGSRVILCPGTCIGEGVSIGEGSFLYPNVTVREKVSIGREVIIHSGTVVGADGFGYVYTENTHYKIPQTGSVIIGDHVEIGANTVIDRGTVGNTIIGAGTKIDNLVQIAHNVKIGKNCIIVAQAGISGSAEIGDGAILAGQAGVRDHMKVGPGAIIAAQSGVGTDIPERQIFSGSPAIPHKTWLRAQSIFSKLPDYVKRIKAIEKKLHKEEHSDDERP
jgi:UDP-3-O-[3-hydroxymyristoyl] glucosamine N-acyltransferase